MWLCFSNKLVMIQKNMDIMDNTEETNSAPQVQTDEELRITEKAVELLKTVFDPEIPVNVYDLGLIYRIE